MIFLLRVLTLTCLWSTLMPRLNAQLYLDDASGSGIVPFNLCNCTTGNPISPVQSSGSAASATLVYSIVNEEIISINPTNGQQTFIAPFSYGVNNLVLGPNGLLYSVVQASDGTNSLLSINPATGVVTNLGNLPPDFGMQGDLFFFNGNLYGLAVSGSSSVIAQIPLTNPFDVVIVHDYGNEFINLVGALTLTLDGVSTVVVYGEELLTGANGLYTVNMATGAYTPLCPGLMVGDLAAAPNAVVNNCCNADAGTFLSLSPVTRCQNALATAVHNGDETLPAGYELYFLLVNDPTPELPGDVLLVSDQASFAFDPDLLDLNTTYYIVALAAPAGPDYDANCIDLSAAVPVIWKPLPTVNLAASPPDVCATGCVTLQLSFTGASPITADWSAPTQNGTVSGSWTSAPGTSSFTLCAPPGDAFVPGATTLQLLALSDAFCTCTW